MGISEMVGIRREDVYYFGMGKQAPTFSEFGNDLNFAQAYTWAHWRTQRRAVRGGGFKHPH